MASISPSKRLTNVPASSLASSNKKWEYMVMILCKS